MKTNTAITALVAAASLVGAIGLAYAQSGSTSGTYQTPQQSQMGATDGTPNNNSTMNNGATPPTAGAPMDNSAPAPTTNNTMSAQPDLAPQADRN